MTVDFGRTWQRLDAMLERYDASFKAEVASGALWEAELRLTLTDPRAAPSRSITFYAAGAAFPEDAARQVLDDADAWLLTADTAPMPVPDWLR